MTKEFTLEIRKSLRLSALPRYFGGVRFPASMKTLRHRLLLLALACTCGGLHAQTTVSTAPVGFVSTTLNAATDNNFGLPLQQPAALQTTLTAVSGNVLTTGAALTANQFVYNAGVQSNTYYVLVNSSATASLNGTWYAITANDASTITVSPNGGSTLQALGLSSGDSVSVIPFWSLNTLFPNGSGITATTNFGALKTQIFVLPQNTPGINLSSQATYIYYTGSGFTSGWYNIGTLTLANDQVLSPDSYMIIRNVGVAAQVTVTGAVPASGGGSISTPVGTLVAGKAQDNFVLNPLPIPLTLSQLNMFESGAFTPTTSFGALKDVLFIYSPSSTGYNTSSTASLIYWTGGQGFVNGWYNVGTLQGPLDNTQVLAGGEGFIWRKAASATPSTVNWTVTAPY